MSLYQRFDR